MIAEFLKDLNLVKMYDDNSKFYSTHILIMTMDTDENLY